MDALRVNPDSLSRPPSGSDARFRPFRRGSCIVRLADSLHDLEACLALERGHPSPLRWRLVEPTAVPDCDFLVAADLGRRILGVCRLLPLRPEEVRHSLPGAPRVDIGNPLFSGPACPAALLTALRYSCRGVLGAGSMAIVDGIGEPEAVKVAEALWEGVAGYMSDLGYGYVLGRELVNPPPGLALEVVFRILQDDHGLHPDLEAGTVSARYLRVRPAAAPSKRAGQSDPMDRTDRINPEGDRAAPRSQARDWLPKGFQEGLRRGIHLIGGPLQSSAAEGLEFSWVASGDLLRRDG